MLEKKLAFRPRTAADDRVLLGFNDMTFLFSQSGKFFKKKMVSLQDQKRWIRDSLSSLQKVQRSSGLIPILFRNRLLSKVCEEA